MVIFLGKARRILFSLLLLPWLPSAKPGLSLQAHWSWNSCNTGSVNLRHGCQIHAVARAQQLFTTSHRKHQQPSLALGFSGTRGFWTWTQTYCSSASTHLQLWGKHSYKCDFSFFIMSFPGLCFVPSVWQRVQVGCCGAAFTLVRDSPLLHWAPKTLP